MDGLPDDLQFLPPTKERESDAFLKCLLLDTILLLCTTESGRQFLRKNKAYPILREMNLKETDEKCDEVCIEIVQLLQRDEEAVER